MPNGVNAIPADPLAEFQGALVAALAEPVANLVFERLASEPVGDPDPWIDVPTAAAYMGCSENRIHKLTRSGALRHGRDGRKLLLRRSAIDDYLLGLR